ncbi:MAG TPA: multicopper oxidase domain-containing protein [Allosphingosinicella sp.]|nr:multicopper oxidase domain-containing protein [Allosphingosinicella sp.]
MDSISRRQLLQGAAAAAALSGGVSAVPAEAQRRRRAAAPPGGGDWNHLRCAFKETTLDGHKVRLRAYNDQIPGPPIVTRPGATLRVRLENGLPPMSPAGWNGDHNVPHRFDLTNLHFHGLDIRPHLFQPLGTSDPLAPMIAVPTGGRQDYVFEIPNDHPPGLYWYHPHHHGSTVVQAVTGMAGIIIMQGPIDDVPQIRAARDIVLAIQDIGLFPSDVPADAGKDIWNYEPQQNAIWQTFAGNVTKYDPAQGKAVPTNPPLNCGFTTGDYPLRYFLMNGEPFFKEVHNPAAPPQPTPTQLPVQRITMRPGEVVRFRMLNACSDNLMPIIVEDHDVHLIALDGVNFDAVRTVASVPVTGPAQMLLAPANRTEFLIKGNPRPGIYKVIQLAQNQQFLESAEKTVCEIEIKGEPMDMGLPTALPPPTRYYPLIKPEDIERVRTLEFGGAFPGVANPYVGIDFLINNMQYQTEAIPTVVRLGDEEEWHLIVSGPHHGGTEGHPFHIHEVSFEVIKIGDAVQLPGTIQDTIWIPKDTEVVVRMRFLGWPGKTVFHCHILPHEDTGMMQNFLIVDPGGPAHH